MAGEEYQGLSFFSPTCLARTHHRLNKGFLVELLDACGVLLTNPVGRLAQRLKWGHPEDRKEQAMVVWFGIVPGHPATEL